MTYPYMLFDKFATSTYMLLYLRHISLAGNPKSASFKTDTKSIHPRTRGEQEYSDKFVQLANYRKSF